MKTQTLISLLLMICLVQGVGGCATQSWYEGMKISAQKQCDKQAPGAREECLARLNTKNYNAYEKERAAAQ
jgi:hypothetical protein